VVTRSGAAFTSTATDWPSGRQMRISTSWLWTPRTAVTGGSCPEGSGAPSASQIEPSQRLVVKSSMSWPNSSSAQALACQ
jgi:hypothetical protein